jgi:hypothetical protein
MVLVWLVRKSYYPFVFPLKKILTSWSVSVSVQIQISHSIDAQHYVCYPLLVNEVVHFFITSNFGFMTF